MTTLDDMLDDQQFASAPSAAMPGVRKTVPVVRVWRNSPLSVRIVSTLVGIDLSMMMSCRASKSHPAAGETLVGKADALGPRPTSKSKILIKYRANINCENEA